MVEMKVLGSHEEWLKARTKIGGSDASAIVGMNPYKTNVDLFKEKAYSIEPEDISDKPYVKYGTEAEKHLRELFKLDYPEYQVGYVENNMFTNDKYPWAHASLDGWLLDQDGRKGVWECKTTNILQSRQKEKWDHRIPDNYYIHPTYVENDNDEYVEATATEMNEPEAQAPQAEPQDTQNNAQNTQNSVQDPQPAPAENPQPEMNAAEAALFGSFK